MMGLIVVVREFGDVRFEEVRDGLTVNKSSTTTFILMAKHNDF